VAPWITVLSRHTVLQIYFGVIFRKTRHHAQAHVTSCTLIHYVPLLWLREEHRRQGSWVDDFTRQCLLWRLLLRLAAAAAAAAIVLNITCLST